MSSLVIIKFEKPYFSIFSLKSILIIFKNIMYILFTNIMKILYLPFLDYQLLVFDFFLFFQLIVWILEWNKVHYLLLFNILKTCTHQIHLCTSNDLFFFSLFFWFMLFYFILNKGKFPTTLPSTTSVVEKITKEISPSHMIKIWVSRIGVCF